MNAPRNHHFMPAFYLKRWEDPSGQITEYKTKVGLIRQILWRVARFDEAMAVAKLRWRGKVRTVQSPLSLAAAGAISYCRPVMPGWNYTVRLYRPREEILDGKWRCPGRSR